MSYINIHHPSAKQIAEHLLDIEAIQINTKQPFTWSSGLKAPIYCDNRLSLSRPKLRNSITTSLVDVIKKHFESVTYIAGVATAGIAQGVLVADKLDLPYIYVRPQAKDHGKRSQIEGRIEQGAKVVIVEDLVSTGGSIARVAVALRKAGMEIIGAIAIFTYSFDIASQVLEQDNIPCICLSSFEHILNANGKKRLTPEEIKILDAWQCKPQ